MSKSTQNLIEQYKARDFEYISYKDFVKIMTTLDQIDRQLKRCCSVTERINMLKRSKSNSTGTCSVNGVVNEVVGLLKQQMISAKIKVFCVLAKTSL